MAGAWENGSSPVGGEIPRECGRSEVGKTQSSIAEGVDRNREAPPLNPIQGISS